MAEEAAGGSEAADDHLLRKELVGRLARSARDRLPPRGASPLRESLMKSSQLLTVLIGILPNQVQAQVTIDVDTAETHQTIEGWGTCLIAWQDGWRERYRTPEFQRLYVEEMGCNILRINLWGPVHTKPVTDSEDITWRDFDFNVDGGRPQIFVDFAKGIQKLDSDVKLIGTVWSPPVWMKVNQRLTDADGSGAIQGTGYERDGRVFTNRVDPKYFEHFAQWLVEMVKYHQQQRTPLYAVSVGNEVMFTQEFESCVWNAEDYATIVRLVGKRLDAAGLNDVKIFGPETMTTHNWSIANPLYIERLMSEPSVAEHFDVFATHGYTDGVEADTRADSAHEFARLIEKYDRPFWITEGGTGGHEWPAALNEIGAMLHGSLVGGNASAFVPWQISEREPSTHGLMVGERFSKKSNVARQYFRFVRPGDVRVTANCPDRRLRVSAFLAPAKDRLSLVLANSARDSISVRLALGDFSVGSIQATRTSRDEDFAAIDPPRGAADAIELPAESITTLVVTSGATTKNER
jgi:glucuronoarabinoxylan endo-1,4-beta-xylanase